VRKATIFIVAPHLGQSIWSTSYGEPAARVAAVKIAPHDFLDGRPEEAVFLLEAALMLREEPVEIMKEHPIKDGPLGTAGTIHSRHGGRMASRNRNKRQSNAGMGRTMYLPTRSASFLVLARTRRKTEKPVWRQERRRSAHSELRSSLWTRNPRSSRAKSAGAELPRQPAVVLEEEPQPLRDDKDDLAAGNIQKECLPHPFAPLLKPFGVARWAEAAGASAEHQEAFRMAVI
jgi:hypothetical protein